MADTDKILEGVLMQLGQINSNVAKLAEKLEVFTTDLGEFSERFEEVVSQLEDERRLDLLRDYD